MSSKSLSSVKVSRPIRLYLLLSWFVAGYYVISISRDGLLGDVMFPKVTDAAGLPETQSPHSDVNQLLFKQLNELKSCPVVKLRGLSRSKGKARPMNRFEAFIFLNGMYFVLRLRSLVSLIKDLLLRAGDVEVNPGPSPPVTSDCGESSTGSGSLLPGTPDCGESSTGVRPPPPVIPDRGESSTGVGSLPLDRGEYSTGVGSLPLDRGESSTGVGSLPLDRGESSTGVGSLPPDHGESSTGVGSLPPDHGESSTGVGSLPPGTTDCGESSTRNVEVNPGQGSPYHYESSTATPNSDQLEQILENSDMSILGRTQLVQATISPADNEPVDRKFSERPTSLSDLLPRNDPQRFPPEKKDEFHNDDSSLEFPPPRQEGEQGTVEKYDLVQSKHDSDSSGMPKRSIQPTEKGDEQSAIPFTLPSGRVHNRRRSQPSIAFNAQNRRKKPNFQNEELSTEELSLLDSNIEELIQTDEALNPLTDFFIYANKHYRSQEGCEVCPTCLKLKKDSGQKPQSHVIPKCILRYYWEIHSTDESTAYIHDFSRCRMLSAKALTYKLLCKECETHYSESEQYLLTVYLDIAANPDVDYIMIHKDEQSPTWLNYILANILFRGILANIDLSDIEKESMVFKYIYYLWKYCRNSDKKCEPLNLKVFLLPNKPFNEILHDFMFPFEILVRMPHCTELVVRDDIGTFFYTKFDVFHIVLPLCEKSNNYFDTFNNGLTIERENLCLRWAALQKAEKNEDNKLIEFKYSPEFATLRDHFPEALLGWCASLYEKFVSRLYNHPPEHTLRPFLSAIDRSCGTQYVGFDTEYRINIADVLKSAIIIDQRASQTTYFNDQNKKEKLRKNLVSKASGYSPLRRRHIEKLKTKLVEAENELGDTRRELGDTKKELGDTRKELGDTKKELGDTRRELGDTKKELGDTRKELGDVQQKQEQVESEVVHLQYENSRLTEKIDSNQLELLSSRAELRDTRYTLEEITKAQIQADKEELKSLTFLYKSSLRHNRCLEYPPRTDTEHDQRLECPPKTDTDLLKSIIADKVKNFDNLCELARGTSSYQSYRELREGYRRLLSLTPPSHQPHQLQEAFEVM